jgi:bile acid:Na+ symporter, BASS family
MDIRSIIVLFMQISLVMLVVSIGMQAQWRDLLAVWRQPKMLLRAILAVNVVVPAVAVIAVLALPMAPIIKLGIVAMAVSPMPPFVPGKMVKAGAHVGLGIGLYLALLLLAVVLVPATMALMDLFSPADIAVSVAVVARFVIMFVLVPIAIGLLMGSFAPQPSKRFAPFVNMAAMILLLPPFLLIVIKSGAGIVGLLGDGTLVAILVAIAAGLIAGTMLGGPKPENRLALALAAATRHPAIASLIIHQYRDDRRAMLTIMLFLLTSLIVTALYQHWAGKRASMEATPVGTG